MKQHGLTHVALDYSREKHPDGSPNLTNFSTTASIYKSIFDTNELFLVDWHLVDSNHKDKYQIKLSIIKNSMLELGFNDIYIYNNDLPKKQTQWRTLI